MREIIRTLFLFCCIILPVIHGLNQSPNAVKHWFKNLSHKNQKITKLHFYFHDTVRGKSPTAVEVAQSDFTFKSRTLFGLVNVIDDPLTTGPEPNSTEVGRAQGFYAAAGLEELSLLVSMNLVFTVGKYNGSTLSILGRNTVMEHYREMPIIRGSGVFRLARGVAMAKTHSLDQKRGNAIVEYHVVAIHY